MLQGSNKCGDQTKETQTILLFDTITDWAITQPHITKLDAGHKQIISQAINELLTSIESSASGNDEAEGLHEKSISTTRTSIAEGLELVESACSVVGKVPDFGYIDIVVDVCKILRHFVLPKVVQNSNKKLNVMKKAVKAQTATQLGSLTAVQTDHMLTDIKVLQHFPEIIDTSCDLKKL